MTPTGRLIADTCFNIACLGVLLYIGAAIACIIQRRVDRNRRRAAKALMESTLKEAPEIDLDYWRDRFEKAIKEREA